jgi:hypothetical protein
VRRELPRPEAGVTIHGVELAHKIKKGQFDTSELRLEGVQARELWGGLGSVGQR